MAMKSAQLVAALLLLTVTASQPRHLRPARGHVLGDQQLRTRGPGHALGDQQLRTRGPGHVLGDQQLRTRGPGHVLGDQQLPSVTAAPRAGATPWEAGGRGLGLEQSSLQMLEELGNTLDLERDILEVLSSSSSDRGLEHRILQLVVELEAARLRAGSEEGGLATPWS